MVPPIIGESPVIHNIKTLIGKVAKTGENILICGETGVGKDLVAQSLYDQSNREGKPFVKVNCAGLTESLLEIEIPCFDQTGTNRAFIISSANHDLGKMVNEGKFIESLYFRLSTVRIDIKPLRKRPEDIPFLIDYYLKQYDSAYNGHKTMALDRGTIDDLCAYHWPGNVRELQNILKRIIFFESTGEKISDLIGTSKEVYKSVDDETIKEMMPHSISFSDFFSMHASELTALPFKEARKKIVDMAEKELISNALEKTGWNRVKANQILNIAYKTLLSKIRELNIQPSKL